MPLTDVTRAYPVRCRRSIVVHEDRQCIEWVMWGWRLETAKSGAPAFFGLAQTFIRQVSTKMLRIRKPTASIPAASSSRRLPARSRRPAHAAPAFLAYHRTDDAVQA